MTFLHLDGSWNLSSTENGIKDIRINIPGDVHHALLNEKKIVDPFVGRNEKYVEWVHNCTWKMAKEFEISYNPDDYIMINLKLSNVDTYASFYVNEKHVLNTTNCFKTYNVNIKNYLKKGKNLIEAIFFPAFAEAERLSSCLEYPIPWSQGNNQLPHLNLIRKPQFHSGWDWGPYIVPIGIYDSVSIEPIKSSEIRSIKSFQNISEGKATVKFEIKIHKHSKELELLKIKFGSQIQSLEIAEEGEMIKTTTFEVDNPKLWNTHDYGTPFLYEVSAEIGNAKLTKEIGIRKIDVTSIDGKFQIVLNGRRIFVKGANVIPLDILHGRETKERYRNLIADAKSANMNLLRVWGGGYYLHDDFYEECDRAGILVWQDLMFACAAYPNLCWFVDEVEEEIRDQIDRLQSHPCICLWCGDNEGWTALNWYKESKENIAFYREEYGKLNNKIKKFVNEGDRSRVFWRSSPWSGTEDFQEGFVDPSYSKGDCHFWEVWHGKSDFSGFLNITPHFCSEFGFQSYPSLPSVKYFAPNATSIDDPDFAAHQKNGAGNQKIFKMLERYFNVPKSFANILYLSQVQQALGIKTGCEQFRRIPGCSGSIFWQLNDCWPVSSWSAVEYGGRWKPLMYEAVRFYKPFALSFKETSEVIELYYVNDRDEFETELTVEVFNFDGELIEQSKFNISAKRDASELIWTSGHADNRFVVAKCSSFCAFCSLCGYKREFPDPKLEAKVEAENGRTKITLSAEKPAFFVHLESDKVRKFSDSFVLVMPGEPQCITCDEAIDGSDLTIYSLNKCS